jgi:hypothetical protein
MDIVKTNLIIAGLWVLLAAPASVLSAVFKRKRSDSEVARGLYRLGFLSWVAWLSAGAFALQAGVIAVTTTSASSSGDILPLWTLFGLVGLVFQRSRLNNVGYSGWWTLLTFGSFVLGGALTVYFKVGVNPLEQQLAKWSTIVGCFPLVIFWIMLLFAPANYRSTRRVDPTFFVGFAFGILWLIIISLSWGENELLKMQTASPGGLMATAVRSTIALFQTRQHTIQPPRYSSATASEQPAELKRRHEIASNDIKSVANWPKANIYGEVLVPFPSTLEPMNSGIEQIPLEARKYIYSFKTWAGGCQDLTILVRRVASGLNQAPSISLAGMLESVRKLAGPRAFKIDEIMPLAQFDPTAVFGRSWAITNDNRRLQIDAICWNSGDVKWIVLVTSRRQSEDERGRAIIDSLRKF